MTSENPENLNVLIVEDDTSFLKLLELRLRSWRKNITLTVAGSIAEAKAKLQSPEAAFDLVILDQHLPDGRGTELFNDELLGTAAVLAVSSDAAPELPGETVRRGAKHFLGKRQVSEPLFIPLLQAIIERKQLEDKLLAAVLKEKRMETIKTLLATLRHEINNPLGAVLGGLYLLRSSGSLDEQQLNALKLVEKSSERIKHVLNALCETAELEEVTKGHEQLFHVPGDPSWDKK